VEYKRTVKPSHILVVDDQEYNRDVLSRPLKKEGHDVALAENGIQALEVLKTEDFDLVLLDVMMPELDGYGVLKRMKADPVLREIPVIVISALDELESIVRCIELGAEDYLTKPFNPVFLNARTKACLEKKQLRDQELKSQKKIATQLDDACAYVRSLLPPPINSEIRIDWRYIPSSELGGDSFGYHWLDEDRLAIYLLDVCGHGVGPALLSISMMTLLRSQTFKTDLTDPSGVLDFLNKTFPREKHNGKHFSIWYGVYDKTKRKLIYSSGGHPPAVLIGADGPQRLTTSGMIMGMFPDVTYRNSVRKIEPGMKLYVFSDGAYEIEKPGGEVMELDEFIQILIATDPAAESNVERIYRQLQEINGRESLMDDVSVIEVIF
jgi:sigma-B regulation protein RsbU (phosphoserine phosphatase)